jgi:phospholipase C
MERQVYQSIDAPSFFLLTSRTGCESDQEGFACFPFSWKTVPEFHQDANVTWMVYQDVDNFGDDALQSFTQYMNAGPDDPLTLYGSSYPGLNKFYADAEAGTLPQVSWIVGPAELSEHVPYSPHDGAWLQKQVVDAVVNGAAYNETVLIISYDGKRMHFNQDMNSNWRLESGGWGDHVTPFHSPPGTAGEWMNVENNVFGELGDIYTGPGKPYGVMSLISKSKDRRIPSSILHHFSMDTRRACLYRTCRPQLPDHVRWYVVNTPNKSYD